MSHDRSTVEAVVNHYFDAPLRRQCRQARRDLPPHRRPALGRKGRTAGPDRARLAGSRSKRPSAKAEGKPREDFIVTIDRSDESTAFIKVRCQLPPRYFTDYLVAMKLEGRLADRLEVLPLRSQAIATAIPRH